MKLLIKIVAALVLLLGLITFSYQQLKPIAIVTSPQKGTAVDIAAGNVKIVPALEMFATARTHGKVAWTCELPNNGRLKVSQGDVICLLDSAELTKEITRAKDELKAAQDRLANGSHLEIELANLRQDYTHNQKLAAIDQYPIAYLQKQARDIERMECLLTQQKIDLDRQLKHRQAHLQNLLIQKDKMTITAPMDGVLTEVYFLPGHTVWDGNNCGKIIAESTLAQISINEEDFLGIEPGQKVKIALLGIAGQSFDATVSFLTATANSDSKRRIVHADFTCAHPNIVPGMTGEATITKAEHTNTLIIPKRALMGNYVYQVKDNKIIAQPVNIGFQGLQKAEILSGLTEDDLIVTEDLSSFRDSDKVRIQQS